MIYPTKEWYQAMQRSDWHVGLQEAKEAETYSEEYFRRLYRAEEQKWMSLYPREPDVMKQKFAQIYRCSCREIKKNVPADILAQVADIRVLALHTASPAVLKAITAYCENNDRLVREAMDTYDREYDAYCAAHPDWKDPLKNVWLHDGVILAALKKGKDFIIQIENQGDSFPGFIIRFQNATILHNEPPLAGAWWFYEALRETNGQYELHMLAGRGQHLKELILRADNIILTSDE